LGDKWKIYWIRSCSIS